MLDARGAPFFPGNVLVLFKSSVLKRRYATIRYRRTLPGVETPV
jgi:hypothetical protein